MGDKLKIGIIGCGHAAQMHLNGYAAEKDVEIAALCSRSGTNVAALVEEFALDNARVYSSYDEMLDAEKLDAVSVCTYNALHAPAAISALEHGAHVLLEKPFTVTVDEAVEVMRAEKRTGKFVSIGFQPRYNANMQAIKDIVRSGVLGDVYYVQTGGGRRRGLPKTDSFVRRETAGIGALGDIGCYSLDMVLNALGYPKPLTVSGYASNYFGRRPGYEFSDRFEVEDFAAAFVRLEGGIVLDFRIAWAMHPDTSGDTIIYGKEGALRIPSTECWNGNVGGAMTLYRDVGGVPSETKIPTVDDAELDECFPRKIHAFVEAVKKGGPAPIPTSQALVNQVIINSIIESAAAGHEIEVKFPQI